MFLSNSCYRQCRRLASTRRSEADWFANGPTALSSCWPGGPTTWLGDEGGGRGRGVRGQDSGRRTSVDDGRPMCLSCSHHRHSGRCDLGIATYRTISTVLFYVGIATFRRGAIPIFWLFIRNQIMRRFLVNKTGDCGSPTTPKKPKADSERLESMRIEGDKVLRLRGTTSLPGWPTSRHRQIPIPTAHRQAHRPLPVPRLPTVLLLSHRRSPCPSTRCSAHPVARVMGWVHQWDYRIVDSLGSTQRVLSWSAVQTWRGRHWRRTKPVTATASNTRETEQRALELLSPNSRFRRWIGPSLISLINYSGMQTPLQRTIGHSPIMCGWQPWMKGRGCF